MEDSLENLERPYDGVIGSIPLAERDTILSCDLSGESDWILREKYDMLAGSTCYLPRALTSILCSQFGMIKVDIYHHKACSRKGRENRQVSVVASASTASQQN